MRYRIVLVPFPFDDLSGSKVRPALCLTDPIGAYDHVIIAFLTSQISKAIEESDIPIRSTDPDFAETGLKLDSAIRLHRLVTIPIKLMQRQLGSLPVVYQNAFKDRLRALLEL